jgi:2-methylisocitrate lyase-like PEP mutase family enzyme
VAGISIEDQIPGTKALYDFDLAVDRIRAARQAIDASGGDTLLVARTECFVVGHPEPLKESIRRLVAFSETGGDCLYAPHVNTPETIAAVVAAVAPKPVNVLAAGLGGLTVADLAGLGVRRISTGGALARTAWTGFLRAAREIAGEGAFAALDSAVPNGEVDGLLARNGK